MYCPVCFQNTLKFRSNGVIKASFNGKSRNTSLFTYNLNKDDAAELDKKLREKLVDFFAWYAEFKNKLPITAIELTSSDVQCSNACKIDLTTSRFSVIGVLYSSKVVEALASEEAKKFGIELQLPRP